MRRRPFLTGLAATAAAFGAGPVAAQTLDDAEGSVPASGEPNPTEAGFRAWVSAFRPRALAAGIDATTYDRTLRSAALLPKVIERDRSQNEFTKTIWDYLDVAVSDDRVSGGVRAFERQRRTLSAIEDRYGVDAAVVTAIWGLESAYGGYRGDTPTISALATLAYDGRRAAFYEDQLLAALAILRDGHVTPEAMVGSWAGAMGHTQFMPTSWRDFAVDFDTDGRRDIWGDDPADALASTANYLAHFGWTRRQPWGLEVALPEGFDYAQTTERVKRPVDTWRAAGVTPMAGGRLPDGPDASVLLPAGHTGPAFLIFPNFQVIEKYNLADAYVIAIGHLADRIKGGAPIGASWPRRWRALTLPERRELQERLTAAGFDTFGVDGRIGPKTVASVKAWQAARGDVPDGYASPDVLDALRGG